MNENNQNNQNKNSQISTRTILVYILIALSVFIIASTSIINNKIGSYVILTETIKENNKTIIKEKLAIRIHDNNSSAKDKYIQDSSYIYYGYFLLLVLTITLISQSNKYTNCYNDDE